MSPGLRTLVLGEALVDLICEHPASGAADADSFRPHFGGAAANVCVAAARHGADIALAGGVGDDAWGQWLFLRLKEEAVGLDWFSLIPGAQTSVAFVTVDASGDPDFVIYGEGIRAAVEAAGTTLNTAIERSDAFVFASNTLVGDSERETTLKARSHALSLRKPVVFDPNLRLHRWPSVDHAIAVVRGCIADTFLLKCNAAEAKLLTDSPDAEAAALALLTAGARNVVITLGAGGAILRGAHRKDAPGVHANVVNATGAGDAFLGVLLAVLSANNYDDDALVDALEIAVEVAARSTEHWGAV